MRLTQEHKSEHNWPTLIRQYREHLELSMEEFGKKYGVVRQTVFYWEKGLTGAPYDVTWDIMQWLAEGQKGQAE